MIRKSIYCSITGKVQGVGFRNWVKKKSIKYTLTGWVKNCENNIVELEVSGIENKLNLFLRDLKSGPLLSKVDNVNFKFIKYKPFRGFKII